MKETMPSAANSNEAPRNHHELQTAAREQYNTLLEQNGWPHGDEIPHATAEQLKDIITTLEPMVAAMSQAERYYARDLSVLLNQATHYYTAAQQPVAA